jgi:dTDP-4-dehydrorhamnose reductase
MAIDGKILVTGSNGQLGSELKELSAQYPQFQFTFLNRSEASIDDSIALAKAFEKFHPNYVINCAAYTAVDKAEEEEKLALTINGIAVGALAALCKAYDAKFIHISTDYVFDGNDKEPIKETNKTNPVSAYGKTKLAGEELAIENNPASIIIRTSWVYSSYGKNFVKTMIRLMQEKERINVVNDQYGSPTYAADLASAILQIINSGEWVPGIYNYSNEGVISWFDFAQKIKELISSPCIVQPIPTEQYPTPAKRPKYSVLDKSKIQQIFHIQLKPWEESLKLCIKKLKTTTD